MSKESPLATKLAEKIVLKAENLSKSYIDAGSKVDVLKKLNLTVNKGEIISVVGVSGSGKSTLLHVLSGLDELTSGKVKIDQHCLTDLKAKQSDQIRNQYFGFIYQFHHLLAGFTALENVAMPLLIGGVSVIESEKKALALLKRVGLEQRISHRISELSGGERQRVAIARALVTEPTCVLADEPTGNLDKKTAEQVFKLILELNKELGISFIIVTHDLELAKKAHRSLRLVGGKLIKIH